tara:strand:- start:10370 stop:11212 length:843 start_codon:yes stop_codon:yes gene_type:complete
MFEVFYNQTIRKMTVAFGSMFNNVYATRLNSDGTTAAHVRVPLGYGPKDKWVRRLREQNPLDEDSNETSITLPRLSFEMTSLTYDPDRKKNTIQKRFLKGTQNEKIMRNYVEVPYDIEFSVSAMVKFMEDGLSIMEQILPYFTPEFTVTINFNDINQKVDVPIVLNSVNVNEDYEGDFDTRRLITFDMNFTAKTHVFGPIKTSSTIQNVTATLLQPDSFYHDGTSLGLSGTNAAMSKVLVGVTGPSGSSSGVDNFTAYTTDVRVYGMTGEDGISLDGTNL